MRQHLKYLCSLNVEVGNKASPLVGILVGTMHCDHGVVVAKRSERGDQPGDGVGVLITSTVLSWGVAGEILSVQRDGRVGALGCEENIDVVSNNVSISVEDNIEVQ